MKKKKIYLVFKNNNCPAFCCSNREILWQKISEELFDGARVRLNPYTIENYIQYLDKHTNDWNTSDVYYTTIGCYECDE